MRLKIRLRTAGKTCLATCEEFNLHAEAPSAREAIKRIEEAFYFAIQFPDFVEAKSSAFA
jgi:hypothetical protein